MAGIYDLGIGEAAQVGNSIYSTMVQDRLGTERNAISARQADSQIANAQVENNIKQYALKKAEEADAANKRIVDMTVHPMYLALPDTVKPKVLEYFASQGLVDAQGRGEVGKIMSGVQQIESTKPLFNEFMGPVLEAKKGQVIEAYSAMQDAMAKGDANKIAEAKANYQKMNMAYQASTGNFAKHLEGLDKLHNVSAGATAINAGGEAVYTAPDKATSASDVQKTLVDLYGQNAFDKMTPAQKEAAYVKLKGSVAGVTRININQPGTNDIKAIAQDIADGQLSMKQVSKRGLTQSQVIGQVKQMYPKFDFIKSDANYNYMNNSNILRATGLAAAAMPRVYDLYSKMEGLKNTFGVPLLDEPWNKARKALGSKEVTDFESLRNAIIQEVNTALSGSSTASDYRIKLELENLKSGMTVGQQMASVGNLISALQARQDASTMVVYPWEVVRGEKTMEQWKAEQKVEAEKVKIMRFNTGGSGSRITNKTVVKQFVSPSTGKTKIVYSDGTEEIR